VRAGDLLVHLIENYAHLCAKELFVNFIIMVTIILICLLFVFHVELPQDLSFSLHAPSTREEFQQVRSVMSLVGMCE